MRQLKRIDAVKRSPLYVHFDETLSGLATIRAFDQQDKFIARFDQLVDSSQAAWYPIIVGERYGHCVICHSLYRAKMYYYYSN